MLVGGVRPGLPLLLRPQASAIRMAAGDAAAAANLFANVRLPASILAGALVPLGFGFALPAEGPALAPGTRRAVIRTHRLVAVTSYSCLLVAIVYASVTINGLAESAHQPSAGAMDLIRHEYELAWIGTNVSFLLGLFGALALVTLRVLLTFERDEGRVAAAVSLSTVSPSPTPSPSPRSCPDSNPNPNPDSYPEPSPYPDTNQALLMASIVDEQAQRGGPNPNPNPNPNP